MSFFGTELNAQVNRLMFEIKVQLSKNKFMPNFRTIYRSFVKYDPEVSGQLQPHRFEKGLNENGIFFKKYEIQVFEKAYKNQNGKLNWFNFMGHLRQPMGPARRQLVEKIFDSIDANKEGKLSPNALMSYFNCKEIEAFKTGKKTQEMVEEDFLSMISMPQNVISKEQFIAFYDDLNLNFPNNQTFFRFVSIQWHYTMQKVEAAKEEEIKAACKSLRTKLIQISQGTKDEYLLGKLFKQYDVNGNGYLGTYELDIMLKKLNQNVPSKIVEPLLFKLDRNQTGYIQYGQFKDFLFYDPYPI